MKPAIPPFAGRAIKGWPTTVVRRGEVIIENGNCQAAPGSGNYLPRVGGWAAEPTGRPRARVRP